MEASPIDAPVMVLDDEPTNGIRSAKKVHRRPTVPCSGVVLLSQPFDVPDSNCLIQRGREEYVLTWVKLCTHHVVIVSGEDGNAVAVLPIPNTDGLIVGRRKQPGAFMMELHRTDVIQMSQKGELHLTCTVGPNDNLKVITSTCENGLRAVEVDSSYGAFMSFEFIEKSAQVVIPKLDCPIVKRDQNPGVLRVEGEAFHTKTPGLALQQHFAQFTISQQVKNLLLRPSEGEQRSLSV